MEHKKNKIEVCFSPALLGLFDAAGKIVIVIDVLRATSSICVAFAQGAEEIVPVAKIEECLTYKEKGFLIAGERNGEMLPGFDFGNSPFSYMGIHLKGKSIALTTTNGTQAIEAAKNSHCVVIGSFLNLEVLCQWLSGQRKDIICLCAGWKNKFNLEDTLFAGAVGDYLLSGDLFSTDCDSTIAARHLYRLAKSDLHGFLSDSSHRRRLERLNIEKDVAYCLTPNQANVIPVLEGSSLRSMKFNLQNKTQLSN